MHVLDLGYSKSIPRIHSRCLTLSQPYRQQSNRSSKSAVRTYLEDSTNFRLTIIDELKISQHKIYRERNTSKTSFLTNIRTKAIIEVEKASHCLMKQFVLLQLLLWHCEWKLVSDPKPYPLRLWNNGEKVCCFHQCKTASAWTSNTGCTLFCLKIERFIESNVSFTKMNRTFCLSAQCFVAHSKTAARQ